MYTAVTMNETSRIKDSAVTPAEVVGQKELEDARQSAWALLSLVADIRVAVGDPRGRLMQDELVERCRKMREALERLRDCDWVITLPDRMDAVRGIAREALEMPAR